MNELWINKVSKVINKSERKSILRYAPGVKYRFLFVLLFEYKLPLSTLLSMHTEAVDIKLNRIMFKLQNVIHIVKLSNRHMSMAAQYLNLSALKRCMYLFPGRLAGQHLHAEHLTHVYEKMIYSHLNNKGIKEIA